MASKIKLFCMVLAAAGAVFFFNSRSLSYQADNPAVRIAIAKEINNFIVSARGSYRIMDMDSGLKLESGSKLGKKRVSLKDDGIHIGKNFYHTKRARIFAKKDIAIYIDGKHKQYRGIIDFIVVPKGILVVNYLDMEQYVRGVLYHEVSNKWPMEAMKAQAVATRSYALYQIESNKAQPYDVSSDIYSQVYGGRSAEHFRTNLAAGATKGEILTFQGKVLPAYFHSNSGGYTEDVSELWKQNLSPLKGVPDDYSNGAPHYLWKKNFKSSAIQEKLKAKKFNIGAIEDIKVINRNRSGRIRKLQITDRDGKSIEIDGKSFREIVGPNDIKSNNYDVVMKGYYFDLEGKGWGHGVGMSQWGAYNMSQKRFTYREILNYYYPGAAIKHY